ncbi:MAG: hypothetical protein ACLFRK_01070 [Candidatus Nanohaloarchaea archaeon]
MKGMAHTPFAIFAVTVLFLLFMVPLNSIPQEAEIQVKGSEVADADAQSLKSAFKKGVAISASDYLKASNQYIVDNGFVNDAEASIDFDAGEFNGTEMNYVNYSSWSSGLEPMYSQRGHSLEYIHGNYSLEPGLKLQASADLNYNFTYSPRSTRYSFNDTIKGIEGLKGPDPLLENASGGSFTPKYSYCGFEKPAELLGTATGSEVAHGYAAVEPRIGEVDHSRSRILVTEDVSEYGSIPDDFSGVVTEEGTIPSGDYATVEGLELNVTDGASLILDNGEAWNSHFRKVMDENCYLENSNAPGVLNRMEGSFSAESGGLTTFTDEGGSSEPNEAYLYYNSSSPALVEISGVTTGDYGNFRPDFMLSDDTGDDSIDEWSLSGLVS